MKELRLQDLLNMADAAAHDSICDLWNEKTVHLLVIFTSPDQDFEIIGVGPALPYTTLEAAAAHVIPNKKPEFYVKCPAAIAGRLQPRLAPGPVKSATRSPHAPAVMPTLKGRTAVPFVRPALKLPSKTPEERPGTENAEAVSPIVTTTPAAAPSPPETGPVQSVSSVTEPAKAVSLPSPEERERAIARREQELAALAASLKIREASLREREAALAAIEENLIRPPSKAN